MLQRRLYFLKKLCEIDDLKVPRFQYTSVKTKFPVKMFF